MIITQRGMKRHLGKTYSLLTCIFTCNLGQLNLKLKLQFSLPKNSHHLVFSLLLSLDAVDGDMTEKECNPETCSLEIQEHKKWLRKKQACYGLPSALPVSLISIIFAFFLLWTQTIWTLTHRNLNLAYASYLLMPPTCK